MTGIEKKDENSAAQGVKISGRFDQYRSSYWAAAIALLPIRYLPRPFFRKQWNNGSFFLKNMYSAFAGVVMEGVTAYFAYCTYKDMRSIFSQALAWEFNKDPKDVTFSDFRSSKNTIVQQTMGNFISRNLQRAGVNATFFAPFIFSKSFEKFKLDPEAGVDFGLGANAVYLYKDIVTRKMSPFEALQAAIDKKINHTENFSDKMHANDLLDIYERQAAKGEINSFLSQRNTPAWERGMTVFTRMADLINQTYGNSVKTEKADFTMPKFIYMVGQNMIEPDKIDQTLALIEVANTHGISALNQAVKSLKSGMPLADALKPCPVTVPGTSCAVPETEPASEKKFAPELAAAHSRPLAKPPGAYADKTAKDASFQQGI